MIKDILANIILKQQDDISAWFARYYQTLQPLVYSSIDIRESADKLAPVDTNLFPAGFNNLTAAAIDAGAIILKSYLEKYYAAGKKILIITEAHTRNLFYLDNLQAIVTIIKQAGYACDLANFSLQNDVVLTSASNQEVFIKKITSIDASYDLILLNNDLTNGIPQQLQHTKIPILPGVNFGWHARKKSEHFKQYNLLAAKFCSDFQLDPFFITTLHASHHIANFRDKQGLAMIAQSIDEIIASLKIKYQEYNIKQTPYVFIKSDMGTYGMGIMTANCGDDILNINKDTRNKMNAIKSGVANDQIMIQEGISTALNYQNFPAEKMIYCLGGTPVSAITRFNNLKNNHSNLNSKGMQFSSTASYDAYDSYGLIAQLATLACCFENV
jgi:glutamate--cysteine ligase